MFNRIYCAMIFVVAGVAAHPAFAAEFLSFEFTEHPSRSAEPAPYRIELTIADDGAFRATWSYLTAEQNLSPVAPQTGVLAAEELQRLRDACARISLLEPTTRQYDIGYGTKPEPGWRGTLFVTVDGAKRGAAFTSLRPAGDGERDTALNQLVTLVFDLKNLTRDKLNVPVARAKPVD